MTVNTKMGKITASKEVLCELNICIFKAEQAYRQDGRKNLANYYREVHSQIFDALDETGYFDDVK